MRIGHQLLYLEELISNGKLKSNYNFECVKFLYASQHKPYIFEYVKCLLSLRQQKYYYM